MDHTIEDASIDFIYIDPPFNTGKEQVSSTGKSYQDSFDNMDNFLEEIVEFAYKKLKPNGGLSFI